jgi:hypothetical protein
MDDDVAEALAELERATAKYRRYERARDEVHAAIVKAFKAGARPVDVEKRSPYDRNHNARLRDAAGVPGVRARRKKP